MYRSGNVALLLLLCLCVFVPVSAALAQAPTTAAPADVTLFDPTATVPARQFLVGTYVQDGQLVDKVIVPGRPPVGYRAPVAQVPTANPALGINVLTDVPAFEWSYGCSPTSAAMMMGYYDRHGYPNMYAGSANGGICPLDNSVWGHTSYPSITCSECPFSASHEGVEGRNIGGHVDDYWVDYNSLSPDPYTTGGWTEHTADCLGDFMGTNQSRYGNPDGATTFYFNPSGSPLCNYNAGSSSRDGCYGMRLFAQSRGYTVVSNCSQYIQGYDGNSNGFTFAQYCAEIDAGRPVLIQVAGHTMLGYGYNTTDNIVYLHDTWDYNEHTMTWGGKYSDMEHYGVTTFQLAAAPTSILTDTSAVTVPEGDVAIFRVKLSSMPTDNTSVSVSRYSGDEDISVQSGTTLTFTPSNWDSYQTVTLVAAQDVDAIDGSAIFRCSASGWGTEDVTATESDDDRVVLVDRTSMEIAEGDQGTFYVKLQGQPDSTVTVSSVRSGDTDISIQSGSNLTFTTSNWNVYQPVVVAAAHDADAVDDSALIQCGLGGWTGANVNVAALDSDGLTVPQMKQSADGAAVLCRPMTVTGVFGDSFYIEADDRSVGVRVHNVGHGVTVGMKASVSGTMATDTDGERFIEASTVVQGGSGTLTPLLVANRNVGGGDWFYDAATGAGQRRVLNGMGLSNVGILVRTFGRVVERQNPVIRFWNFDTDPGWSFTGQWAWGVPLGGGSANHDPTSGYTGTRVVGYNLSGDYANTMPAYYATTPAVDCTGRAVVKLKFYRWLGVESASYDHASIQVSTNGTNWTDVWDHVGPSLSESAWSYQVYDISSIAANHPTVYVRWVMGATDPSVTYPGWNIDDVTIGSDGESYCVIDDGSGVDLKVTVPPGVTPPPLDSYISVTGVSSCQSRNGDIYPLLKVRTETDIN